MLLTRAQRLTLIPIVAVFGLLALAIDDAHWVVAGFTGLEIIVIWRFASDIKEVICEWFAMFVDEFGGIWH